MSDTHSRDTAARADARIRAAHAEAQSLSSVGGTPMTSDPVARGQLDGEPHRAAIAKNGISPTTPLNGHRTRSNEPIPRPIRPAE